MMTHDDERAAYEAAHRIAAELGERNRNEALAEYERLLADPALAHVDAGELARQVRVRREINLQTWREWTKGERYGRQ